MGHTARTGPVPRSVTAPEGSEKMKRSAQLFSSVLAGTTTLVSAAPAYAQYDQTGDTAAVFGVFACWGISILFLLAVTVFNIWMLIDSIARQEWEYPSGTSKTTWLVLMAVGLIFSFGWIVALVYYFTVYKKIKRGTMAPPSPQQPATTYGAPPPPAACR